MDWVAQTSIGHSKESHKGPDMNNGNRERLKTPLIRENGRHRAASWDEALDRVADGFRSQVEKRGPRTFGMFSCSKTTNELNYVAQKFVRSVIGTNNIDSCNRTGHAPSVAGLAAVFGAGGGTSSYREIEECDVILRWGSSARDTDAAWLRDVRGA